MTVSIEGPQRDAASHVYVLESKEAVGSRTIGSHSLHERRLLFEFIAGHFSGRSSIACHIFTHMHITSRDMYEPEYSQLRLQCNILISSWPRG